jgi:hypothetical protein
MNGFLALEQLRHSPLRLSENKIPNTAIMGEKDKVDLLEQVLIGHEKPEVHGSGWEV